VPAPFARYWNRRMIVVLRCRIWPAVAPPGLVWADEALRYLRRTLPARGIDTEIPAPPRARQRLSAVIARWLEWRGATCLERSLILQRWLLEAGRPHDLLIGVRRLGDAVIAHAWLDHEDPRGYTELVRLAPSRVLPRLPDELAGAVALR